MRVARCNLRNINFRYKQISSTLQPVLQAIAVADGIAQPTSGAFIKDHMLTSASSVAASLKSLSEKEMIVQSDNKWVVYDVFFSRWLEYQYGSK
jgi:hypothetical protein